VRGESVAYAHDHSKEFAAEHSTGLTGPCCAFWNRKGFRQGKTVNIGVNTGTAEAGLSVRGMRDPEKISLCGALMAATRNLNYHGL
jgi:hypothetical protein